MKDTYDGTTAIPRGGIFLSRPSGSLFLVLGGFNFSRRNRGHVVNAWVNFREGLESSPKKSCDAWGKMVVWRDWDFVF